MAECCICKKTPADGTTVFRVNPKGRPGIWACAKHRPQTDAPIDAELDEVVRILELANRP